METNEQLKIIDPLFYSIVQVTKTRKEARNLEKFLKVRYNKEALLDLLARVAKLVDAQS